MWCNDAHSKVDPYFVDKEHRPISVYWNLKKWIQKFSLKQDTLNEIRSFVKDLKTNLESCTSSSMNITRKHSFFGETCTELSEHEQIRFQFAAPTQIDLVGSFLYHGVCFNPRYAHTKRMNVDIAVCIPTPQSVTLSDIVRGHYLLKRRAYVSLLFAQVQRKYAAYRTFIDYLNHDPMKPIVVIATDNCAQCFIRIIPTLDVKQLAQCVGGGDNDDSGDIDEAQVMRRIFFGTHHAKLSVLQAEYGEDLHAWSGKKLAQALYGSLDGDALFAHYLYAQQTLEDVCMRSTFLEFYAACKTNPNLHRALVLLKAWWNAHNLHCDHIDDDDDDNDNDSGMRTDASRYGDVNSFHLTQYVLLVHRTYHIDKWDSPLLVMAKCLELMSREEFGSWLCGEPPCSLFEKHASWYTSFADSHLFTSLSSHVSQHKDRRSVFETRRAPSGSASGADNANIYTADNEDGDALSEVHYAYNIWRNKKHGVSMAVGSGDDGLLDEWLQDHSERDFHVLLLQQRFAVLFTNVSGLINYTFRVNISNYLRFLRQARKASVALNALLGEMPFMPNPEYWAYKNAINPRHYDIVNYAVINFHEQCVANLLTPPHHSFFMHFDGVIKLDADSLLMQPPQAQSMDVLPMILRLERVLMTALSDRCRSFTIYYKPRKGKSSRLIYIGVSLYTFAFRELIIGPPYTEKQAVKAFKQFWGADVVRNKRFPDGNIFSTVTLNHAQDFASQLCSIDRQAKQCHVNKQRARHATIKNSAAHKKNRKGGGGSDGGVPYKRPPSFVIRVILEHILQRHFKLDARHLSLKVDPFWSITPYSLPHCRRMGEKTASSALNAAFDHLESTLRRVCNSRKFVPLKLMDCVRIDASLWHVTAWPPKAINMAYASYALVDGVPALQVALKFNANEFWPNSGVKAVNSLKLALYIQLQRGLQHCRVRTLLSKQYLDVLMDGYCFRCCIVADTDFVVHKYAQLQHVRYHFRFLPKLGKLIEGVSAKYAYYAPSVSLVQRWLHCNLFSHLIDAPVVAVLVADLFVNSDSLPCPQSEFVAFVRFLHLLRTFAWLEKPYVVDLGCGGSGSGGGGGGGSGESSSSSTPMAYQFNILKSKMLNARMNDEALHAMYVVVPGLMDLSQWTRQTPTLQTLQRLVKAANVSYQHIYQKLSSPMVLADDVLDDDDFLRVFKPDKREFDFVIVLHPTHISRHSDHLWRTPNGVDEWRQQQILKRMNRLTMEQQKYVQRKKTSAVEEQKKKENAADGDGDADASLSTQIMPFIANAEWEQKKRTFEMYRRPENESSDVQQPKAKKRRLSGHQWDNKIEQLVHENPDKYLQENELLVVGVDAVQNYVAELKKFTSQQIEVFFDENGGDYIGCKWLVPAHSSTQKTVFSAIWELGSRLVKAIKIQKSPSSTQSLALQPQKTTVDKHRHIDADVDNVEREWTVVNPVSVQNV